MKKAREMYDLLKADGLHHTFKEKRWMEYFVIIEKRIEKDEDVLLCFYGAIADETSVFAVTNKRLIVVQKKFLSDEFFAIMLDDIKDVAFHTSVYGIFRISTDSMLLEFELNKQLGIIVDTKLRKIMQEFKQKKNFSTNVAHIDPTIELKKYKGLLDDGVITQDEFEAKKKQLLRL